MRTFGIIVILFAVFSILFFSVSTFAEKESCAVTLVSESGTKGNMTFNYVISAECFDEFVFLIQVSNSSSFSNSVEVAASSPTQTSGVNCSALTSGQAYWRIVQIDGDSKIEVSTPDYRGFQLPN